MNLDFFFFFASKEYVGKYRNTWEMWRSVWIFFLNLLHELSKRHFLHILKTDARELTWVTMPCHQGWSCVWIGHLQLMLTKVFLLSRWMAGSSSSMIASVLVWAWSRSTYLMVALAAIWWTVSRSRSWCNWWFDTYQGVPVILRSMTFSSPWMIWRLLLAADPHSGMLYDQIGLNVENMKEMWKNMKEYIMLPYTWVVGLGKFLGLPVGEGLGVRHLWVYGVPQKKDMKHVNKKKKNRRKQKKRHFFVW